MLLTKRLIAALVGVVALIWIAVRSAEAEDPKTPAAAAVALSPEIQQALEENARQLSPISLSYTMQFKSESSIDETAARMKLPAGERSLFSKMICRTAWQGHSFYHSMKHDPQGAEPNGRSMDMEMAYVGDVQFRNFRAGAGGTAQIMKMRTHKSMGMDQELSIFYLGSAPLLSLQWELGDAGKLQMESEILNALKKGMVRSVEDVMLDGRAHVRLTLETENFVRKRADAMALQYEAMSRQTSVPPEVLEQRKKFLENTEEQRKTPLTRRVIVDLDPAMHYAVRRVEQWYDPDVLLRRTTCSDFDQVTGRSLWLPRHCETEWHEFLTTPTVSQDVLLTQVFEIVEMNAGPVPDQLFTLNSTTPGTIIQDGTLTGGPNSGRMVTYTVPQRAEDLEDVIAKARQHTADLQLAPPNAAGPNSGRGGPILESGSMETSDGPPLMWILMSLNGVFLAGAVGYVLYKKRRSG